MGGLGGQVVAVQELPSQGRSDNRVERVVLADGRRLVRKVVEPEQDWISRATRDRGRVVAMWEAGLFARLPPEIEHATVAVEPDDAGGWAVFMRDVSAHLVPLDARPGRADVRRLLAALAALHARFRGEDFPQLCGLEDRYALLSPRTARREQALGSPLGDTVALGWKVLADLLPDDVARPVLALAEDPAPLAAELRRHRQTLVHGDVRLANLGLGSADGAPVVLVDWGERTGTAPAEVEVASFLVFDGWRLDVSRDDVLDDVRELARADHDERALRLALLGAVVQLGPTLLVGLLEGTAAGRVRAEAEVAWWTGALRRALEAWSPG